MAHVLSKLQKQHAKRRSGERCTPKIKIDQWSRVNLGVGLRTRGLTRNVKISAFLIKQARSARALFKFVPVYRHRRVVPRVHLHVLRRLVLPRNRLLALVLLCNVLRLEVLLRVGHAVLLLRML